MAMIAVVAVSGLSVCASIAAAVMGGEVTFVPKDPAPVVPGGVTTSATVPEPVGLYTIQQGIRHQGHNPDAGSEDLWYSSNPGQPWNKYYKFACEDSAGNESVKVGPYGPISFHTYGDPTIRFAPKNTKPCNSNSIVVYRGDTKDGDYSVIHRKVNDTIVNG